MYLREFRPNLPPLLAACLGMAVGSALNHYTMSLFGPALIQEFGWSRADYALVGSLALVNLFFLPFAGWFIDRFGTRPGAAAGFVALVLGYLALASMNGSITWFFAIIVLTNLFGGLSATLVFCRVVVQRFDAARGVALALVMSAAPLGSAIAVPALGALIDDYGWRAGYLTLASVSAVGGTVAILMMGPQRATAPHGYRASRVTREELLGLLRNPLLILLLAGMFLVNIPHIFAASQLKLIALDKGVTSEFATGLLSLYAVGVIVGRFVGGLALDHVRPHLVAIAALGLPAIGYLLFAMPMASSFTLAGGVVLVGLAQGAEGDIGAYLVSRRFDVARFSLLLSLMTAMLGAGSAAGSLILSLTLRLAGDYTPFLLVSAGATLVGACCFAMTGSRRFRSPDGQEPARHS